MARKQRQTDLVTTVRDGISSLISEERSPEAKLLRRRDRKVANLRRHRRVFSIVSFFLILLNFTIFGLSGWTFPFALFPILFWGMGFTIHSFGTRAWLRDNELELSRAAARLGRLPAGAGPLALPAPKDAPVINGITIRDESWIRLLAQCKNTVASTENALEQLPPETDTTELSVRLTTGFENVEQLAAGAQRIRDAIDQTDADYIDRQIEELDERIGQTEDEELVQALLANRTLIVSRRAKLEELEQEAQRMRAHGEGFMLAVENMRLDIAGLERGERLKSEALAEPTAKLQKEVEILRKVESELRVFRQLEQRH